MASPFPSARLHGSSLHFESKSEPGPVSPTIAFSPIVAFSQSDADTVATTLFGQMDALSEPLARRLCKTATGLFLPASGCALLFLRETAPGRDGGAFVKLGSTLVACRFPARSLVSILAWQYHLFPHPHATIALRASQHALAPVSLSRFSQTLQAAHLRQRHHPWRRRGTTPVGNREAAVRARRRGPRGGVGRRVRAADGAA